MLGNQTLVVKFWLAAVDLAIDAGRCHVDSEIAITDLAVLGDNCCRREEPYCHSASFRFIRCRIVLQLDHSLKLAIVDIFAIVWAHPKSKQVKLNLACRQLQDFKTVRSFRMAESVVTGDYLRGLRRRSRLRDQSLSTNEIKQQQTKNEYTGTGRCGDGEHGDHFPIVIWHSLASTAALLWVVIKLLLLLADFDGLAADNSIPWTGDVNRRFSLLEQFTDPPSTNPHEATRNLVGASSADFVDRL